MIIGVGCSSTRVALGFSMSLDYPINQIENPNHIPRLWDILIHVDPLPLGDSIKFFKLEYSGEFKEGDIIIRVEFLGSTICVLNWMFCHSGEGTFELGLCRFQWNKFQQQY